MRRQSEAYDANEDERGGWGELVRCSRDELQMEGPIAERASISLCDDDRKSAHVAFASYEAECQDDSWYGASIPLDRATRRDAEVVLALEMNDEPLTISHGYPVRVVTPGIAGARSVKWLNQITIQKKESQNHYQQRDYKVMPPEATDAETAEKYWDTTAAIMEMPVNSVIAWPESGGKVRRGENDLVQVLGYALPSGANGPVVKFEVSSDGGSSWTEAELIDHEEEGKWSRKLWQMVIALRPGKCPALYSRATDAAGNTQPEESQWNLRGVCYNEWGATEDFEIL
ncbi:uncharacterized protein MYCFIDRAFT_215526 [Pseudocercospora fijiensis CIRAD86]|uniref:Sulfite oxidase n=1 Tax=Pseudocercospora fijiensis (strain CIRAD86) TaxID=383855 RepID=M3ABF0_PSEFD|nr:uncharacterized protein MYCFIDRAFT_215526 [Pseudocercospora fijiensis CIRAD86]EME81911.1 hypothetical protein MYCFIDRAFT_215526 [Pseudocercospora fijiensis CIRAD86]